MYLLDGDSFFVEPENVTKKLEDQFQNCLDQLLVKPLVKKLFKLNFFVDAESYDDYLSIQGFIREKVSETFSGKIILNFIAQPPLQSKLILEAFYFDDTQWAARFCEHPNGGAFVFTRQKTRILVGNVQSNGKFPCKEQAENSFSALKEIIENNGFRIGDIFRQWNYIEGIIGFDGNNQHYQNYNNVRSRYYGNDFEKGGYPAATGIGMNEGGIIIEFQALKSEEAVSIPVDNPGQVAAHVYSKEVLVGEDCFTKTTPKFERARFLSLFGKKMLFISGTASITGEKTIGLKDPVEQSETTIKNIKLLYSKPVLESLGFNGGRAKYGHARVYVKKRCDYELIREAFEKHYGKLPVVYILADICRDNLLVEIEGEIIFL